MTNTKSKPLVPPDDHPARTDVSGSLADSTAVELPGGDAIVSDEDGKPTRIDTVGKNPFKAMGGSDRPSFNSVLLRKTLDTIGPLQGAGRVEQIAAAGAALAAFKPTDEIEAMLAAQAVAMHYSAMECFRRAMLSGQPDEVATKLRRDGANLARGMADMLDALDRKRGKAPQVVRVERVVVQEGGQAVVGNVTGAGG